MAARRSRNRRRRRRGRFGFLYKLLSALLILAAILTGCVVFFRVDRIEVYGQSRYTQEEIVDASGVERGQNLFLLNKLEVADRVLTRLPYVDELSISRRLPDALVISVTECVPVAALEWDGAWWVLDAKGKVLEQGDAALAQGKAVLSGLTPLGLTVGAPLAAEESDKLGSLRALLSALAAEQMTGSVTGFIDLTAENEIRFSYGDGLTVVVPLYEDDFPGVIARLKYTLWEMDDSGVARSGTLDLTYENEAHLFPERWLPQGWAAQDGAGAGEAGQTSDGAAPDPGGSGESQPEQSEPSQSVAPSAPVQAAVPEGAQQAAQPAEDQP